MGTYNASNSQTIQAYWPQSELKIITALSLNEIVNSPDEFVSKVYPNLMLSEAIR